MDYTLLQAHNTTPGDVEDAIRLLAPHWAGGTAVDHSDFWVTVPTTETAARALAPRLASLIGDDVVTTTVAGDECRMALDRPGGDRTVGPVDGRDTGAATELAGALRGRKAEEFAAALATDLPAAERHRSAARALGLPVPDLSGLRQHAGLLVVWAAAGTVRSRLPVDGHGAHVVPLGSNACLVVPDGSGWSTDPRTHGRAFTRTAGTPLPVVGIDWGTNPAMWVSSGPEDSTLDLAAPSRGQVAAAAAAVARVAGRPELETKVAAALDPAADVSAGRRAADLLGVLGAGDVPAGASAGDLASWAAERDGGTHVAAQPGRAVALRHDDPAAVAPAFRQRRNLRRVRNAAGILELVGWVGIVIFVTQGPIVWAAPTIVAIGLLELLRRYLKRRLPPPESRR
ncbi:hypothetical protein ABZV93_20595 [Actinopolymorpha sp. NPDC004070]|uniref:hypothetical protein n=1 Tax=Actinopolymorpha sp. NPDC004070 TaxID=3154548 RepID=UPI0033BF38E8